MWKGKQLSNCIVVWTEDHIFRSGDPLCSACISIASNNLDTCQFIYFISIIHLKVGKFFLSEEIVMHVNICWKNFKVGKPKWTPVCVRKCGKISNNVNQTMKISSINKRSKKENKFLSNLHQRSLQWRIEIVVISCININILAHFSCDNPGIVDGRKDSEKIPYPKHVRF